MKKTDKITMNTSLIAQNNVLYGRGSSGALKHWEQVRSNIFKIVRVELNYINIS